MRLILLLLAAAMPATALAQDVVVMRRQIAPAKLDRAPSRQTYVGTYTETYGACTNNNQTTPLVSCKRSDGTPVAASYCAATKSQRCSSGCEAVSGDRWTGRFINGNTEVRRHSQAINGYSEIQAACESLYKSYGIGACFFAPTTRNGVPVWPSNVLYYEQYAWSTFANRPDLTGANCGQ